MLHLLKVMHYAKTEDEDLQCIALGHDLFEDTAVVPTTLRNMGFSERVIDGIDNLTKRLAEPEDEYITRIMRSRDSIVVKLADLRHNSDIRRLKGLREKDFERMQKYHRMYLTLTEAMNAPSAQD
ncbi:hypothetical protein D3C86_1598100 [compost metagenome]